MLKFGGTRSFEWVEPYSATFRYKMIFSNILLKSDKGKGLDYFAQQHRLLSDYLFQGLGILYTG